MSVANLLHHVGELDAARRVKAALFGAIQSGRSTGDIGGKLSCTEFTAEVVKRL